MDEDDGWAAAESGGGEVQETMENLRKGNRAREKKENQRRVRHGWGRGKTARSLRGGRTRQLHVERLRKRTDRRQM